MRYYLPPGGVEGDPVAGVDVWSVPVGRGDARRLADLPGASAGPAGYSPELGLALFIGSPADPEQSGVNRGPAELTVVDTRGGGVAWRVPLPGVLVGQQLFGYGDLGAYRMLVEASALSPDSRTLSVAHAHNDAVTVVDLVARAAEIRVPHETNGVAGAVTGWLAGFPGETAEAKGGDVAYRTAALSPSGRVLYVAGNSSVEGRANCEMPRRLASCGFSAPAGLRAIDTTSFELLGEDDRVDSFELSPDGRYLAVTGQRSRFDGGESTEPDVGLGIRLLEAGTLREVAVLEWDSFAGSMKFDSTGRYLYVLSGPPMSLTPPTFRLYDLQARRAVDERDLELGGLLLP